MKILITGSNGQLGQALIKALSDHIVYPHDIDTLDITQADAVETCVAELQPDFVINAAAYTAVDKAESDVETADAINHKAVANLAEACANHNVRMIHVSTDFVFDGRNSTPYTPEDTCNPVSVYGETKRDGEIALLTKLFERATVVRTAWLYSETGANFVKTMLRLMQERDQLSVVCDQVGTPTSASGLARVIARMVDSNQSNGIYHWTDAGAASWYDFAVAIYEEARAINLLNKEVNILPIPAQNYPTPAERPHYSVLDKSRCYTEFDLPAIHWRVELRNVLVALSQKEKTVG